MASFKHWNLAVIIGAVVGALISLSWILDQDAKPSLASQVGQQAYYSGTTGSIGGSALLVGACSTGTASIVGVTQGMPVAVSASDGTNIPATGLDLSGTVTANGTVTVSVCALVAVTPVAKTYNVRVFP